MLKAFVVASAIVPMFPPSSDEQDREPQVMVWIDCDGNELLTSANYAYWWINRYSGGARCRFHHWPWLELQNISTLEPRFWLPVTEMTWTEESPLPTHGGWEMTHERRWECEWCD